MIKCINCGYFLNCKNASQEVKECEKYTKIERIINDGRKKYNTY